jgi:hypothetical protein
VKKLAIGLFQKIVLTGTWDKRDIRPFRLNPAFEKKPTTFEAEFIVQGSSLSYGSTRKKIPEKLRFTP